MIKHSFAPGEIYKFLPQDNIHHVIALYNEASIFATQVATLKQNDIFMLLETTKPLQSYYSYSYDWLKILVNGEIYYFFVLHKQHAFFEKIKEQ